MEGARGGQGENVAKAKKNRERWAKVWQRRAGGGIGTRSSATVTTA